MWFFFFFFVWFILFSLFVLIFFVYLCWLICYCCFLFLILFIFMFVFYVFLSLFCFVFSYCFCFIVFHFIIMFVMFLLENAKLSPGSTWAHALQAFPRNSRKLFKKCSSCFTIINPTPKANLLKSPFFFFGSHQKIKTHQH